MSDTKEVAVVVNDIHKHFILPQNKSTSFKQTVVNIVKKNNKVTQKVLDGVSFEVNKGDFFAIVGRNGSGKSTLLKLLAGVYVPTSGSVQLHGNLTPFIELGVGFNPELSGRDNVFLNGALLGFNRKQMEAMYDEIVSFAELEPFMDQKLKNYSSGMQVRLAFSIAIKAKNEILIFDEVLAVGDEAFQRKCLDVFEEYKAEGQTVILVTHDMETVRQFCNRAVLINDGKVEMVGDPKKIATRYSALNQESIDKGSQKHNQKSLNSGLNVATYDSSQDKKKTSFKIAESMSAKITWLKNEDVAHVVVNIYKKSGEHMTGFRYSLVGDENNAWVNMKPQITSGKYFFTLQVLSTDGAPIVDEVVGAEFMITPEYVSGIEEWSGLVSIDHSWRRP
jgi:ABC-2 type transport system ATP-binding protein